MTSEPEYSKVLGELRAALPKFRPGQSIYDQIVPYRDQVLARYSPIFSPVNVDNLSREDFTSFLYIENNHHWSGLHRKGLGAATDIDKLRRSLAVLLDESRPIRQRFPQALEIVDGLGKGIATAVLTVAYPDKYGVWNNTSEAALRESSLWDTFERGEGIGGRYEQINNILLRLSCDLGIDVWTLDAMWWFLLEPDMPPTPSPEPLDLAGGFALERQLEEFLLENWEQTPLANEWVIFSTPDNPEAGNQYPTSVGRIDILAKHKSEPRFLVVELKRNQSTDQTVAQALRYVGWVKLHLAKPGETVEALIIGRKIEKEAQYAVSMLTNFKLMTYKVEFRLTPSPPLQ
jgi:hypothetical protein